MLKKSLIKVGLVSAGNVLNAAMGFAFLTALARTLDLESFGKYALVSSLLVFLSRLLDFGTNSTFVARALTNGKNIAKETFYGSKVLLFLVALPISASVLLYLKIANTQLLIIFALGLLAYAVNYTLFAFFQKSEKYLQLVLLNTLPALIKGAFAVTIFIGVFIPTYTSGFAVFALSIFSSALLWFFVPNEYKLPEISFSGIKPLVKNASPAGISQMITEGWPAFNNTIAKMASGFADVGIFSLADKVSNIFMLASVSIFTVLLPRNAARQREKKGYDFRETGIMAGIILTLAVIAVGIASLFIQLLFGEKFADSIGILNILIFAAAFTSIHSFMENYFFVREKTQYILYINASKLVLYLTLSMSLVPMIGLKGLAISNLVAAVMSLGLLIEFVRRDVK